MDEIKCLTKMLLEAGKFQNTFFLFVFKQEFVEIKSRLTAEFNQKITVYIDILF
jgi:hypothetical protein